MEKDVSTTGRLKNAVQNETPMMAKTASAIATNSLEPSKIPGTAKPAQMIDSNIPRGLNLVLRVRRGEGFKADVICALMFYCGSTIAELSIRTGTELSTWLSTSAAISSRLAEAFVIIR